MSYCIRIMIAGFVAAACLGLSGTVADWTTVEPPGTRVSFQAPYALEPGQPEQLEPETGYVSWVDLSPEDLPEGSIYVSAVLSRLAPGEPSAPMDIAMYARQIVVSAAEDEEEPGRLVEHTRGFAGGAPVEWMKFEITPRDGDRYRFANLVIGDGDYMVHVTISYSQDSTSQRDDAARVRDSLRVRGRAIESWRSVPIREAK